MFPYTDKLFRNVDKGLPLFTA